MGSTYGSFSFGLYAVIQKLCRKKTKYMRYLGLHALIYGGVMGIAALVWMPVHITWISVLMIAISQIYSVFGWTNDTISTREAFGLVEKKT